MITADTITDEQILQSAADADYRARGRQAVRGRLAAILNARTEQR